jgi:uncharacterized protein with GYD domain
MAYAYVLGEVVPGTVVRACRAVAEVSGVRSTAIVAGPYDFIAAVEAADVGELAKVLSGIRAIDGVTRTLTCRSAPTPTSIPAAEAAGF